LRTFGSDSKVSLAEQVLSDMADLPVECLTGRLGEICQRRLSHLPRAYAWPALLTAASVRTPRVPNDTIRTNLYCGLAGPTASGKTSAIEQSLHVLGLPRDCRVFQAKYGSAEGMLPAIMERIQPGSSCLLNPDELAHLLEKTAIEHSSFAPILNSLYYEDQQLGGTKRHKVEFNGRLSISGGVVEEMFGQLFGSVTTTGLYDRFIFGLCPPAFVYNYTPLTGPPEVLPDALPVQVHSEVWRERTSWQKAYPYLGRTVEHALRAAVICASQDGSPVLMARDLVPAFAFAIYQHRVRSVLRPNPGENPDARCAFQIRAYLEEHAPNGELVRQREVYRGIHAERIGPTVFERTVRNLMRCGELEYRRQSREELLGLKIPSVTTNLVTTGDTSSKRTH
jgi:hypothetical protein